jgi:hypothetical protein
MCQTEAANIANNQAAASSDQLTGHGRKPHGRDAGGKAKRYQTEDAVLRRHQAAWDTLYEQAYNRIFKSRHG